MKFQDSSFNGLKVTVCTKSVTHAPTTVAPKAICPINFFKVGGIIRHNRGVSHYRFYLYHVISKRPSDSNGTSGL